MTENNEDNITHVNASETEQVERQPTGTVEEPTEGTQDPGEHKETVHPELDPFISFEQRKLTQEDFFSNTLSFLNVTESELADRMKSYTRPVGSSSSAGANSWVMAFNMGSEHQMVEDVLSSTAERKNADWRQYIEHEGQKYRFSMPTQKAVPSEDNVISGDQAMMRVTGALGLGTAIFIPLPHTGIWLQIRPPTESAILELQHQIAEDKIRVGRVTHGMAFSNRMVYSTSRLVDFIFDHVYNATVTDIRASSLKKLIKCTDIPMLAWGMAIAINPKGYNYARPCTADPGTCQHIVTGLLNLSKLLWIDNDALSPYQKSVMSKRTGRMEDEDLQKYQKEHTHGTPKRARIADNLSVVLKVPTIEEYESAGFAWVDGVVEAAEKSMAKTLNADQRQAYISNHARTSAMRQYSHWISEIIIDEEGSEQPYRITDAETRDGLLNYLTSSDEIMSTTLNKVGEYIDDSTVAMIAMLKYECPECGGMQKGDYMNDWHHALLPIDAFNAFFTLLGQRVRRALEAKQR